MASIAGVSTGVRTTTLVAARELFVGVLYMTTLPFVIQPTFL
jgi:hypothetical protein